MIIIHTPMKCQNGHENTLVTYFKLGDIIKSYWKDALCECPKGEMDEGYKAHAPDRIFGTALYQTLAPSSY